MAIKAVDATQLDSDLLTVANAIRAKAGISGELEFPAEFVSAIAAITSGDGSGGGIQTASVTAMNSATANNITFTGINAVPDWFVVFADPASTGQISTAEWHYIIVTKIGETISATIAWAEKPSSGMGNGGLFNVEKSTTGITASINLTPTGLKIIGDAYFLRNTKYTIVYGNGSGSGGGGGSGGGSSAPVLGTATVTPSLVTQTATPGAGEDGLSSVVVNPITASLLSGLDLTLLDGDFVESNIKSGVQIFGKTGTYSGGGSSGGGGNIGSEVTMAHTNSTPANAKGYLHCRRATVTTTNLIGFYANPTSRVQKDPDDDSYYHLASVFYDAMNEDGVVGYCSTASNDDTQFRTKLLSQLTGHVNVTVGDGYIEISTPTSQSGSYYLFYDDYEWELYPIYSA